MLPVETYAQEGTAFFFTTRALPHTRPFDRVERCQIVLEALAAQ